MHVNLNAMWNLLWYKHLITQVWNVPVSKWLFHSTWRNKISNHTSNLFYMSVNVYGRFNGSPAYLLDTNEFRLF